MTAVLPKTPTTTDGAWSMMPGWGIVGDLTPPELVAARQLRVLRKLIGVALALVVVLCATGFFYATLQHSKASDALAAANDQTTQEQAALDKYSGITKIQAAVQGVKTQIAGVMGGDVNMPKLIESVRGALPTSMKLTAVTVTFSTPVAADAAEPSLNNTGRSVIGQITVSGTARTLNDLADFVLRLQTVNGFVNVIPGSNSASDKAVTFGLTLSMTDALYSHRYDIKAGS